MMISKRFMWAVKRPAFKPVFTHQWAARRPYSSRPNGSGTPKSDSGKPEQTNAQPEQTKKEEKDQRKTTTLEEAQTFIKKVSLATSADLCDKQWRGIRRVLGQAMPVSSGAQPSKRIGLPLLERLRPGPAMTATSLYELLGEEPALACIASTVNITIMEAVALAMVDYDNSAAKFFGEKLKAARQAGEIGSGDYVLTPVNLRREKISGFVNTTVPRFLSTDFLVPNLTLASGFEEWSGKLRKSRDDTARDKTPTSEALKETFAHELLGWLGQTEKERTDFIAKSDAHRLAHDHFAYLAGTKDGTRKLTSLIRSFHSRLHKSENLESTILGGNDTHRRFEQAAIHEFASEMLNSTANRERSLLEALVGPSLAYEDLLRDFWCQRIEHELCARCNPAVGVLEIESSTHPMRFDAKHRRAVQMFGHDVRNEAGEATGDILEAFLFKESTAAAAERIMKAAAEKAGLEPTQVMGRDELPQGTIKEGLELVIPEEEAVIDPGNVRDHLATAETVRRFLAKTVEDEALWDAQPAKVMADIDRGRAPEVLQTPYMKDFTREAGVKARKLKAPDEDFLLYYQKHGHKLDYHQFFGHSEGETTARQWPLVHGSLDSVKVLAASTYHWWYATDLKESFGNHLAHRESAVFKMHGDLVANEAYKELCRDSLESATFELWHVTDTAWQGERKVREAGEITPWQFRVEVAGPRAASTDFLLRNGKETGAAASQARSQRPKEIRTALSFNDYSMWKERSGDEKVTRTNVSRGESCLTHLDPLLPAAPEDLKGEGLLLDALKEKAHFRLPGGDRPLTETLREEKEEYDKRLIEAFEEEFYSLDRLRDPIGSKEQASDAADKIMRKVDEKMLAHRREGLEASIAGRAAVLKATPESKREDWELLLNQQIDRGQFLFEREAPQGEEPDPLAPLARILGPAAEVVLAMPGDPGLTCPEDVAADERETAGAPKTAAAFEKLKGIYAKGYDGEGKIDNDYLRGAILVYRSLGPEILGDEKTAKLISDAAGTSRILQEAYEKHFPDVLEYPVLINASSPAVIVRTIAIVNGWVDKGNEPAQKRDLWIKNKYDEGTVQYLPATVRDWCAGQRKIEEHFSKSLDHAHSPREFGKPDGREPSPREYFLMCMLAVNSGYFHWQQIQDLRASKYLLFNPFRIETDQPLAYKSEGPNRCYQECVYDVYEDPESSRNRGLRQAREEEKEIKEKETKLKTDLHRSQSQGSDEVKLKTDVYRSQLQKLQQQQQKLQSQGSGASSSTDPKGKTQHSGTDKSDDEAKNKGMADISEIFFIVSMLMIIGYLTYYLSRPTDKNKEGSNSVKFGLNIALSPLGIALLWGAVLAGFLFLKPVLMILPVVLLTVVTFAYASRPL